MGLLCIILNDAQEFCMDDTSPVFSPISNKNR